MIKPESALELLFDEQHNTMQLLVRADYKNDYPSDSAGGLPGKKTKRNMNSAYLPPTDHVKQENIRDLHL